MLSGCHFDWFLSELGVEIPQVERRRELRSEGGLDPLLEDLVPVDTGEPGVLHEFTWLRSLQWVHTNESLFNNIFARSLL